jgi:hypothetical protein
MSWTLDCVLGYFDNLASLALFPSCVVCEIGVYWRQGTEHRFVQCRMVGVDSSGVLSKIIKSRKRFTTMAREWSFSSMLSDWISTDFQPK